MVRLTGLFLLLDAEHSAGGDSFDFRWAFTFPSGRRDDSTATRLGDSLEGLFHLVHGTGGDPIVTYRIPTALIRSGGVIRGEDVALEDHRREDGLGEIFLHSAFTGAIQIAADATEEIWRLLPACREERIFTALADFRTSLSHIDFSPGDIYDVLSFGQADETPTSAVEQAAFDSAFLDGFKAIEALIGEPNKDERRFHAQLRGVGLDPSARIGVRDKVGLADRIRALHFVRDKRAGHGTRPRKKPITKGELIEIQNCARYVIYIAAERALAGQAGSAKRGGSV